MKNNNLAKTRKGLSLAFVFVGLSAVIIALPFLFPSKAGNIQKNLPAKSEERLDYFDIRNDRGSAEILNGWRSAKGLSAVEIADQREKFVLGEEKLKRKVPTLKVEYNKELGNPEIITPDVLGKSALLSEPVRQNRAQMLKDFITENNGLVGLSPDQIDELEVTADYTNPNGGLSFVRLEQSVFGVPVFRAEIRAGFNKQNALFRVVNNLASDIDYSSVSTDFGAPLTAVEKAAQYIDYQLKPNDRQINETESTDLKAVFGQGDWATTAEKMYFPLEGGLLRASWRVLNWQKGAAYYVIVDAETGLMLYRENITYDQTQSATYNVYANTTSLLKAMDNPAPLTPGPVDPALGTQGALQPRTNVSLIGNETPYTFNNNGWITDNTNGTNGHTDGNNAQAGVDRDTTDGIDNVVTGANRVFSFNYTPGAGLGTEGDDPTGAEYQKGAVTNLFYVTNRYHDETYLLGFTEQARNFQQDNFGRGGIGNDRVSAEAQDNTVGPFCPSAPCFNNANFSTPADGGRGKMQMYLWSPTTPDRDGDLDAEIIVHELTHGLFGRLHNGVGGTQAAQMNEGNSDFFGHVMLSETTDPINGVYVTGGYSTLFLRGSSFTSNYYFGIRRFPKAVIAFRGGPNNRPHNPLTYADIDPAQMNLTDGAFTPPFTATATGSHAGGEIWSSMLWEIRARLITRLGAEAGNKKILQLVMDGMKVSPSNPTMIQERNAILSAAAANGNGSDVADIWAGFAARGLGVGATNPTGNTVTESFAVPSTSNPRADFDGDGKTDLSVFRSSDSNWYLNRSTSGFAAINFGLSSDVTTPADFDGDGKADPAVFRSSSVSGTPDFWILQSSNNTLATREWGETGDAPVVDDYNGDGKADAAVYRASTNTWFILNSGGGPTIQGFGAAGDVPVIGDYNGDGKADIAVFRPSSNQWWISNSGANVTAQTFGTSGDKPVPADYDGDNKDDIAIFRPSTGQWWILQSTNGSAVANTFGISTDVPVPGDYDGDGKDDQAVYRNGQWWLNRTASGVATASFGLSTDTPVPARYIP